MKVRARIIDLIMVSKKLATLDARFAFTGGAVVPLLMDHPELVVSRPTKDVDVIVEVVTRIQYTDLEERLRGIGFHHDTSEDAPICRWVFEDVKIDIMPMKDPTGSLNNRWFELALKTAVPFTVRQDQIQIVTAPCFLATKLEAFLGRGAGDFMGSHDIEDFLAVVDGRERLIEEIGTAPQQVREFIGQSVASFMTTHRFLDCLPGHLPPDAASQQRVPIVRERLNRMAMLFGVK